MPTSVCAASPAPLREAVQSFATSSASARAAGSGSKVIVRNPTQFVDTPAPRVAITVSGRGGAAGAGFVVADANTWRVEKAGPPTASRVPGVKVPEGAGA